MRRGFTLIELLAIIAIMAAMVAVSVASVRSGQVAARTRGAARDIYATIRHARSRALVTQQPAIITYSTETVDGEVCARIRIDGAKILDSTKAVQAFTLDGERVDTGTDGDDGGEGGGEAVEDVLFAPIADEVVKGIKIKVLRGGEELEGGETAETGRNKISVFSNVDYLLGRFAEKEAAKKAEAESEAKAEETATAADDRQEPVSVVWEVNGRTEPHRVYVYQDGSKPERGLCIKVDRFGAAKVLAAGEDD